MAEEKDDIVNNLTQGDYKYGFVTNVDTEIFAKGLSEDVVRAISAKKEEPAWMLEFRLKSFEQWKKMSMPEWPHLKLPRIDYQEISYFAAPKKPKYTSLDEVDPELLNTCLLYTSRCV